MICKRDTFTAVNVMKISLVVILVALASLTTVFGAPPSRNGQPISLYVSPKGNDQNPGTQKLPLKTPHKALELLRGVFSDARREIVFLDGCYEFEKPLSLTGDDSDITFRALNKGKAIISASVPVLNWRKESASGKLLVADMPFEPEENSLYLLTVNSKHAKISSFPKGKNIVCPATPGDKTNFYSLPYERSSFPEDFDISSLDLSSVWLSIPQEWAVTRTFIKENDVANARFVLKSPTNMAIGMYNSGFKLINSRLGLDEEGVWMYEKSTKSIIYNPRADEKLEQIEARISRLVTLFDLRDVDVCTIDSLVIEGCLEPFTSKLYDGKPLPAAISAQYCSRLNVRNSIIRNCMGGGVSLLKANRCAIENNRIYDLYKTGISFIDGGAGYCKANSNWMRNLSEGISIQIGHMQCMWNDIAEIGRSAITMWSSFSVVASNRLSNCMLRSRDGGALYGAYDYCLIKDNIVKYTKKSGWPGLYADEGSQHDVFTGNKFEGLWWPTHMHQAYGIVVSNNVFKSDSTMRWSFQGCMFSRFVDNKIFAPAMIKRDAYLANCAEWARNKVYVKDSVTGKYAPAKSVTLERKKAVSRGEINVPRNDAAANGVAQIDGKRLKSEYPIPWTKFVWTDVTEDGYPAPGTQPGIVFSYSHDERYLYVHLHYNFAKTSPYFAHKNFGPRVGVDDTVKLYFGDKVTLTLLWTGASSFEGVNYKFPPGDFKLNEGSWWNGSSMEMRIPLSVIGLKKREFDTAVTFNCESYNADHYLKRYVFPVENGKICTGTLVFPAHLIAGEK